MGNNISQMVMNDYYGMPEYGAILHALPNEGWTDEERELRKQQNLIRMKRDKKMQDISGILALAEDLLIARASTLPPNEVVDMGHIIKFAEMFYNISLEYKNKELEKLEGLK